MMLTIMHVSMATSLAWILTSILRWVVMGSKSLRSGLAGLRYVLLEFIRHLATAGQPFARTPILPQAILTQGSNCCVTSPTWAMTVIYPPDPVSIRKHRSASLIRAPTLVADRMTWVWVSSCGNYYFAPDATALPTITLDIAVRIIGNSALLPAFSATPLSGLAPLSVTFANLSTGPYTSTLWTFGDGNISLTISPTHVYTNPGVYTVTLTIANITTTASLTHTNYIDVSAPQWWIYLPVIQRTS